ncbi:MAG TPA: beta-propeller fold lactonase family protein [Acidobacteriaceae bacterium]|nr:beta-propeller fold lactonase family protein [Acidobacteriaceae bacterium]
MAVVLGMSACGGYTIGFMWVPGTQYNQIAGLKIDDFTGNLTKMVGSPYSSGGSNPVSIVVRLGGNFVFVVNKGTSTAGKPNGDGNVAVFAVGEDGVLTFQQSYTTAGNSPVWATTDTSGSYLYVLDQFAPAATATKAADGDITVFSIDGSTGRLQLVPNQTTKITTGPQTGQQLNYFEVGQTPTMVRVGGGCVYTLDSGDQSILPYGIGSQGQLVVESNSKVFTQTVNMTSLNVSGGNVYITDAGTNTIKPYQTGAACSLSAQVGGSVANLSQTANPVYSMVDNKGKYLYVLNHGTTNLNNANSTISAFIIEPTGALVPISDVSNPYPVGNGPVCMAEDPSSQYIYTANSNDGSITGKRIDSNTGYLYDLARGSSFQATGLATCLAVSGNVD